ncbi:MAG: class I SAM-dependent methyltransferase, partial [Pseudomonadota bacterium]|nr:class I SAM-dependent methyltransferase [Pseudomonadota bacterium]
LGSLGIDARASALAAAAPRRVQAILADRNRLIGEDTMGILFKALAVTAPHWPQPAGFA